MPEFTKATPEQHLSSWALRQGKFLSLPTATSNCPKNIGMEWNRRYNGIFEKFMKCWNAQVEARQTKLSPKLAAIAIEIAGPLRVRVEQTQITPGDTPLSNPAGDQPGGKKRPNPDATAANDAGSKHRKTKVCLLNVSNITTGTKYLTRSVLLKPKAPKPSPSLVFRSRGEPDTTVALSEVKTWDDFLSRCKITEDEIIYYSYEGFFIVCGPRMRMGHVQGFPAW
ncbi:hypothetical protein V8E54_001864 [Elaphomyces granulatus]